MLDLYCILQFCCQGVEQLSDWRSIDDDPLIFSTQFSCALYHEIQFVQYVKSPDNMKKKSRS